MTDSSGASYVGAYYDWETDAVIVWERDENGRRAVPHHAEYYFYVRDDAGEFTSIYGEKLKKLTFDSRDEFTAATRQYANKYESDISPLYKVLMNKYYGLPAPAVHYAFIDIEVDYSSKLGFSSPENPYGPINAVSIFQSWTNKYLSFVVPPKGFKDIERFHQKVKEEIAHHKLNIDYEVTVCSNEVELLTALVNSIQDADIISGWNSEFFDLPYIMKRLEKCAPKLVDRMSFRGCKAPREATVERFGSPAIVYTLNGRTHLDYLACFKKFTFEGRTSYSLGNIASEELDIPKLHYEGTLEQLYKGEYYPATTELTWDDAEKLPPLDRLNAQRALLLKEIERRKLSI